MVHPVLQPDTHKHLLRTLGSLLGRNTRVNQRKLYIFERIQSGQKLKLLKDEPDFLAADMRKLFFVKVAYRASMQDVFAGGRRIQTADDIHQRGFAAAGGTEDGKKLSLSDFQINALENRLHFFSDHILLDDVFHFEKIVAAHGCPPFNGSAPASAASALPCSCRWV